MGRSGLDAAELRTSRSSHLSREAANQPAWSRSVITQIRHLSRLWSYPLLGDAPRALDRLNPDAGGIAAP